MKMEETNFGQVDIYNHLFKDVTIETVKSPTECIEGKLSYCISYNNKRLPIMIGSEIHRKIHSDNPLELNGYFIIDGICKSLTSVYVYSGTLYTKDRAYLSIGRVTIVSMGCYKLFRNGHEKSYSLPVNYSEIASYSANTSRLLEHLELSITNDLSLPLCKNDCVIMCYMLDNWIGIRNNVQYHRRLVTPGETIKEALDHDYDVLKFFRNHTWTIRNIQNVTSISEDMKHYSILSDIESIRRLTYPSTRENMVLNDRLVRDTDKYLICPVQTSDGSLCGTILYLSENARVRNVINIDYDISSNGKYLFIDGKYIGNTTTKFNNITNYEDENIIIIWTLMGQIYTENPRLCSITANYIPYFNYNPAIRSMFTCNMLKQALTCDQRLDIGFNDTKKLIKGEQPLIGKKFYYDSGWNLNVAIMPWFGYNIEDAIIISNSTSKKFASEKINIYSVKFNSTQDRLLDVFVNPGDKVDVNTLLFTAFRPSEYVTLIEMRNTKAGIITKIINHVNCYSIVVNSYRNLEVGDKMSSRHGQKGIVSLIVEDDKMPQYFDNTWIKVDLIINPHAFPSRMTYGQLIEMGNKSFNVKIQNIKVTNDIICGKCYYMALRHQVSDKLQYRNTLELDNVVMQAKSGKKNNGGLRFGHMEKDILLAVGAHSLLDYMYSIDKIIINTDYTGKLISNPGIKFKAHQYLLICAGLLKGLGYEIKCWGNNSIIDEYSIEKVDIDNIERIYGSDQLDFGHTDFLKIKYYQTKYSIIFILPVILRSTLITSLYYRMFSSKNHHNIYNENKKLLYGKNGAYHQYCEGHRLNNCIRSVIIPGPDLPVDTIEIPIGSDIGKSFGLLNRQPSLNYNSLQSVKIKMGVTKCIRFNPLLCESFNADFDGDEMNVFGIDKLYPELPIVTSNIQDYILLDKLKLNNLSELTYLGLTADKKGIELMISMKSKGKLFNLEHLYNKIGDMRLNNMLLGTINSCYSKGLNEDEWYIQCKVAREAASSIGIYTPFTGNLNSICNRNTI